MKPRSGPLDPDDLMLTYTCERDVVVGSTCPNYEDTIQQWWVSVDCYTSTDENSDAHVSVGVARAVLVDLDTPTDPYIALDNLEADLGTIAYGLRGSGDAEAVVDAFTSHLIIIDRVVLSPEFRGQRLGPRIVATIIDRFSRGRTAAAALIAQPTNWHGLRPDELTLAQAKIARAWESIGFLRLNDEVWWMDSTDYEPSQYFVA